MQLKREGSPPPGLRLPQAKLSRKIQSASPRPDLPVRILSTAGLSEWVRHYRSLAISRTVSAGEVGTFPLSVGRIRVAFSGGGIPISFSRVA